MTIPITIKWYLNTLFDMGLEKKQKQLNSYSQ